MSTLAVILFMVCAFLAVCTAVATVTLRSPLRAAVTLLLHIICLAGIFLTLEAHMLAAIQLLVYAGAVVVLFVFVIMLIGPSADGSRSERGLVLRTLSFAVMAIVAFGMAFALVKYDAPRTRVARCSDGAGAECGQFGGVEAVASVLFQPGNTLTRNWRGRIDGRISSIAMTRDISANTIALTVDGEAVAVEAEEERSIFAFDVGNRQAELIIDRSGTGPGQATASIAGENLAPVGAAADVNAAAENEGDEGAGEDAAANGAAAASLAGIARFDAGPGSGEVHVRLAADGFRPLVRVDGDAAEATLRAHSGRYRFTTSAGSGVLSVAEPRSGGEPSYGLLWGDITLPGGQVEPGAALPFELAGILLLVAVIGAIAVARGRSAREAKEAKARRLELERREAAAQAASEGVGPEVATATGRA